MRYELMSKGAASDMNITIMIDTSPIPRYRLQSIANLFLRDEQNLQDLCFVPKVDKPSKMIAIK